MPPQDDLVKAYLLNALGRRGLAAHGGGVYQALSGAQSLFPLLADRTFVCLHYRLTPSGMLEPCDAPPPPPPDPCSAGEQAAESQGPAPALAGRPGPLPLQEAQRGGGQNAAAATMGSNSPDTAGPAVRRAQFVAGESAEAALGLVRPAVHASDVQIGLLVRKGVGGTCPARAAARRLSAQGLLPALLDPCPYLATPPPLPPFAAEDPLPGAPGLPVQANRPVLTQTGPPTPLPQSAAGNALPGPPNPIKSARPLESLSGLSAAEARQPGAAPKEVPGMLRPLLSACSHAGPEIPAPVQLYAAASPAAQQAPAAGAAVPTAAVSAPGRPMPKTCVLASAELDVISALCAQRPNKPATSADGGGRGAAASPELPCVQATAAQASASVPGSTLSAATQLQPVLPHAVQLAPGAPSQARSVHRQALGKLPAPQATTEAGRAGASAQRAMPGDAGRDDSEGLEELLNELHAHHRRAWKGMACSGWPVTMSWAAACHKHLPVTSPACHLSKLRRCAYQLASDLLKKQYQAEQLKCTSHM